MYEVVVTDRSHVPQGTVLGASSVSYFRGLSKLASASFTVPLESEFEDRLADLDANIKLYRDGTLLYVGPVVSAEETADHESRSLAVTSADAGWFLGKRVTGKSSTGTIFSSATGRHVIAKSLVDTANTEAETGVDTATYTYSSGSSITYQAGPYANLLAVVQDLANSMDGFDWLIRPVQNWTNGAVTGSKIGALQIATLIGTSKPDAVFEYGDSTRSNVVSYTKTVTRDQQANKVFHVNQNASDVKTGTNSTAITTWTLMEDVASGDFTDATMRQQLVDEHVRVRANPRVLVQMTPHIDPGDTGHVPQPFVDYDVGDTIQFRATHGGVVKFAGALRVYGIRTAVDPAGFERVELVLADE